MKTGIIICMLLISFVSHAQKYIARDGMAHFFSEAPVENIEAENKHGVSVIDIESGEIAFTIPIQKFMFEKSLMQEHFNENYMESDKYPNAVFKGKIRGFTHSSMEQTLTASGSLTIHGVTNDVIASGTGIWNGDNFILKSSFPVTLKDYNIKIPKVVFYNIAEVVDVTIEFEYQTYEP